LVGWGSGIVSASDCQPLSAVSPGGKATAIGEIKSLKMEGILSGVGGHTWGIILTMFPFQGK
jgi:hypothetical protein